MTLKKWYTSSPSTKATFVLQISQTTGWYRASGSSSALGLNSGSEDDIDDPDTFACFPRLVSFANRNDSVSIVLHCSTNMALYWCV